MMPNTKASDLEKAQTEHETEIEHRIAASLSRGNVSLQLGNFETAEELENCRKSFENYEF